jgi:hypothetical protein
MERAGSGPALGRAFTVDCTLIEAWAGHKSFKRKAEDRQTPQDDPGNPNVDFSQRAAQQRHSSIDHRS